MSIDECANFHIGECFLNYCPWDIFRQYHCAGSFTLPISCLKDPPATLKVRDMKEWYIEYLAEMLANDDQEDLASPLYLPLCQLVNQISGQSA